VNPMLAAVYHGPRDLRVENRPIPVIGPGELLLKVDSASLCATDFRIFDGGHLKYSADTIRIPGHEVVGTIAELGRGVSGVRVGQRVFIAPNVGCGDCRQCQRGHNNLCQNYEAFGITMDGALAEYMRVTSAAVEQGNVVPLASEMDSACVALSEPLACVLHGQEAVRVGDGDSVLILGAGPIGLMHLLLARLRGARQILISDRSSERLEKARECGADRVVNFFEEDIDCVVADEIRGGGADVVIVAVAAREAQEQALRLAGIGGRINLFAGLTKDEPSIRLDSNRVHYKELVVTGTTGCSTADCRRAVEWVTSGKVDLGALISKRFPLRDMASAFSAARDGKHLKVVVQPGLTTS